MKKFINRYDDIIDEMLEGYVTAHADRVERRGERVIASVASPLHGKVGLVTGGGSGH